MTEMNKDGALDKKSGKRSVYLIPLLVIFAWLSACEPVQESPTAMAEETRIQRMPTRTRQADETFTPVTPTEQPVTQQPLTSPTPDPTRPGQREPGETTHLVQYGESLGIIAEAYGTTIEALLARNGLTNADSVLAGQSLIIPIGLLPIGPDAKLIPDSELVYGPAFSHFNVSSFVNHHDGYLVDYQEEVDGQIQSGSEIIQLVAQQYSVGPRLLLALLELKSGWVTNQSPPDETLYYPMGKYQDGWDGLYVQASWAANELNRAFYGWQSGWLHNAEFSDGARIQLAEGLNAGTVAVQVFLAIYNTEAVWDRQVDGQGSLSSIYHAFFGNPFQYAIEPVMPPDLVQPEMTLPWKQGEMWYLTGGPHGGWGSGSAWAALDFVPEGDQLGCYTSDDWVRSISDGRVLRSQNGEVLVDLDDDGFEGTGWVVLYMHIQRSDRVAEGAWLEQGDKIGHPSCEGGVSNGTHVHVARRYNGRWIEADGPIAFVLDGWSAVSYQNEYDGALIKGDWIAEACECREPAMNGITRSW